MDNSPQMESHDLAVSGSTTINASLRSVFVGKAGLRAGWSALLFVAIYLIFSAIETAMLRHFVNMAPKAPLRPSHVFLQELCDVCVVFLTTCIMARIESRSLLSYGFTGGQRLLRLASGALCGLLALSTLIGALWKSHLLVFDGLSSTGAEAWKYGLGWALISLLVGIFEESLLRGYLQYTLARGIGFWWSAVVLSVTFALWHVSNGGESLLGLLVVGLGGFVFCLSLWYTKSLWWAVGFHAGWDWGQSYLYGTPDSGLLTEGHLLRSQPAGSSLWSGGMTGPEGSLLILPLLVTLALGMWTWWGARKSFA
jgi:membrane protease YdiL (CAAX protease family)